ncbi:MAG: DUF748 domain-containing protein [Candidatus Omnitrophota bacterium]
MRLFNTLFKFAGIVVLIIILISLIIFLLFKFQGKGIIEKSLSKTLGFPIKIEKIDFNLDKGKVNFQGFHVLNKKPFSSDLLDAESCTIIFNRDIFSQKRRFIIKELIIDKGIFNIERNKNGKFNIAYNNFLNDISVDISLAYADEFKGINFYKLATQLGKITIKNSLVNFRDSYISSPPYKINFRKLNFNLIADKQQNNYIPLKCEFNFYIVNGYYNDSQVSLEADIVAFKDHSDIKGILRTGQVDLMQFLPYFQRVTPFLFQRGLFSSITNFNLDGDIINSTTEMLFHKLKITVNPDKQNAQFLETSVTKLLPYLTSSSGDVLFDFVVSGPLSNPKAQLGPQVKQAITMAVIQEIGNIIQQFQQLQK